MISAVISRIVILIFGTLYPAYASYKAVKTKNVKEYVRWMMYWIVFAFFTCAETFTDILFSWFPFYYEIKIILVIWLLSPVTKGSSILYRKFVHPHLTKREEEIDSYIARAKAQGYTAVFQLGVNGVNFARELIVQAALKGRGGIVEQLRRSYSLGDLSSQTDGPRTAIPHRRAVTLDSSDDVVFLGEDKNERHQREVRPALNEHTSQDDSGTDTGEATNTASSGYGSAADNRCKVTTTGVQQRGSKRLSSKKPVISEEEPAYATLPRTSKRTTRKRVIYVDE